MIASVKTTTALAFELRQRGLAVRVDLQRPTLPPCTCTAKWLCLSGGSHGNECPRAGFDPSGEWVVWLFKPSEPLILHCTKHRELAAALELAIAEYDDEQGEDHDDGSEVIQ